MNSDLAEISSQQVLDCGRAGQVEKDDLIEPAPECWVEQTLMVRRGDGYRVAPESVEDLEKRVDDSLDLAVFFKRGPILPDGIELAASNPAAPEPPARIGRRDSSQLSFAIES